jgi:hypothetical protein
MEGSSDRSRNLPNAKPTQDISNEDTFTSFFFKKKKHSKQLEGLGD